MDPREGPVDAAAAAADPAGDAVGDPAADAAGTGGGAGGDGLAEVQRRLVLQLLDLMRRLVRLGLQLSAATGEHRVRNEI